MNKWHDRLVNLVAFCWGIVFGTFVITKIGIEIFLYISLASMVIIGISTVYFWVQGIDYMDKNHPDYKGEDFLDDET